MFIEGDIERIRKIEDSIRQTGQYTENLLTERSTHDIQGDTPTVAFTKTYELYIDAPLHDLSMNTTISDVFKWLNSRAVIFRFWYDYRKSVASVKVSNEGLELACHTFECVSIAVNGHQPERIPVKKQRWYEKILAFLARKVVKSVN